MIFYSVPWPFGRICLIFFTSIFCKSKSFIYLNSSRFQKNQCSYNPYKWSYGPLLTNWFLGPSCTTGHQNGFTWTHQLWDSTWSWSFNPYYIYIYTGWWFQFFLVPLDLGFWMHFLLEKVDFQPVILVYWVVATQIVFIFVPIWGNDPIWLIFFRWVETTNLYRCFLFVSGVFFSKEAIIPKMIFDVYISG